MDPRFRCWGYIDARGDWHHGNDGSPIQDVIRVANEGIANANAALAGGAAMDDAR